MIIEDQELRALFKAESDEHLQKIEEGLLRLEVSPSDTSIIEEVFREAHSLKGAAGMLGVSQVEKLAHCFEDALGAAKRQPERLTSGTIDRMCLVLDASRRLAAEAVTGEPSGVDTDGIIRQLSGQDSPAPANVREEPAILDKTSSRIETMRVEPQKLDALMTQTSELMVAKTRIAHRAFQTDRILEIWEEWTRSSKKERPEELAALLSELRDNMHEDGARLESISTRLDESVRSIRLLPLSTVFNLFPRMVRDIAKGANKDVRIVIEGERIAADKRLLEELKDPLMHLVRNAIDHGIESPSEREAIGKNAAGTIRLSASQKGSVIVIDVIDDGRGLSAESIRATALKRGIVTREDLGRMTEHDLQSLIFMPGFSTRTVVTDISGRGVGMDVVRTSIEKLKGDISFESTPGAGCRFRIQLPASLATSRVLLVSVRGELYGLPLEHIHSTRFISAEDLFTLENRESILVDGRPVSLVSLLDLLELPSSDAGPASQAAQSRSCMVIQAGRDMVAFVADELLDEQEVVVRPLGSILKRVRNVSGAAILVSGAICTVLNPLDLIESARKGKGRTKVRPQTVQEKPKQTILLAEDSITTRTWEKRGLEAAGYSVVTAVDGLEALQRLTEHTVDAVVSDVQMPNMDGLSLTERIRQDHKHKELTIILVTSLAADADRKRGIEAGANAYIPKQAFDQKLLVETLQRFI